ncbi:hypothetical protein D3C85_730890 [compost metagenome]
MQPVADGDRIILADQLAEIARGRQVVVQAAIRDEKHLSMRYLAFDHFAYINTRLGHQITAQFQVQAHARRRLAQQIELPLQAVRNGRQVQRLVAGKIRHAEAAADIQGAQGRRRAVGQLQGQLHAQGLRFSQGSRRQALRARIQVKTVKIQPQLANAAQQRRHEGRIDAKRLRAAAHAHARAAQGEIRIHAYGHPGRHAQPFAGQCHPLQLGARLHVDQYASGHGPRQFPIALARPRKTDAFRRHGRIERRGQFAARGHVDAVDQARQPLHHGRHGVGLHRVMHMHASGQGGAQFRHAARDVRAVIGIERRAAHPLRQPAQRNTADLQHVAVHGKLLAQGRVQGQFRTVRADQVLHAASPVWTAYARASSRASKGRSILPFGLRGSTPSRISTHSGTI